MLQSGTILYFLYLVDIKLNKFVSFVRLFKLLICINFIVKIKTFYNKEVFSSAFNRDNKLSKHVYYF